MSRDGEHQHEQPETAVEEVLREIEEARPRDAESERGGRRGGGGDATTPKPRAQEDAGGE
ncbi:hypothetical protein ACFXAQ_34995 [Streptomyces olivaceus]|uniref:hypothetical protein n=1 Tax=Streptomyces olivaceus TaxID=47716 RepID=UPI0036C8EDAA